MSGSGKKKILIVQGYIPHYRVPVFDRLGRESGLDVTVLHSGAASISEDTHYHEIIVKEHHIGPLRYQEQLAMLGKNYDVVIAMFDMRYLSMIQFLLNASNTAVILWGHGFGNREWVNALRFKLLEKADALLLYDSSAKKGFLDRGLPEDRIFVAHNTVHVDTSVDWTVPRSQFLFVGRFTPRKKVQDLIKAYHHAKPRLPDETKVHIIGWGDQLAELEALAESLKVSDSVIFHGKVTDQEKLKAYFAQALAVVSPGHVGLSVLHSFAHGVPVITTDHSEHAPEVSNLNDGNNGLFYDGSVQQLAEAMVQLASDPARALEMGKNARNHYENNRTIDKMSAGFTNAIEYVLNNTN